MSEAPQLIPLERFFGNPSRLCPKISPDGRFLIYAGPDSKDVLQVWLQDVAGGDSKQLTRDPKRGIQMYHWAESGDQVLFLQDQQGDENWHVYTVDLEGRIIRDLTPFQGARADHVMLNPKFPHRMLVGLNLRSAQLFDLYNVDLRTGALELHTENPGDVVRWVVDSEFRVRGAVALTPDAGVEVRIRDDERSPWKQTIFWPYDVAYGDFLGFTPDDGALWLSSSEGGDTARLVRHDPATGHQTVIAEDPESDLLETMIHPLTRAVQAASFGRDREHWKVLDPSVQKDFEVLARLHPGDVSVESRDREDKSWVVQYAADTDPMRYFLLDRNSGEGRMLWSAHPQMQGLPLAEMRPVTIPSRDGLRLQSYLTLPPGGPAENLPMVLLVHGGPHARDYWGYRAEVQWLANRGYAVLQVNYRGSTGFGRRFMRAADREWGAKMHDDLLDGLEWVIGQGLVDRKRIGIFGGSYGGYAALVGAAFTPDVFACAVDIVGPSNLMTLIESIPPYWTPALKMLERELGDPQTEQEFLRSRSPLFKADQIRIPLLIAQGANDPRVKKAESEQIVEAVRAAGKEVDYMVFEDEGHGFARPENRLRFYRRAEAFLARYLGGRSQAEPGANP